MAKYSFRLASLLRLRESTRDECRQALAEVLGHDDRLVRKIEAVQARRAAQRADGQAARQPGLLNVERLRDAHRYECSLQSEEADLLEQRVQLAGEIDLRRAALVSADAEVRALEKLREAGMARHQQDQERAEIQQLDEVALRQAVEKLS
jgi:flagellar FliJ protein